MRKFFQFFFRVYYRGEEGILLLAGVLRAIDDCENIFEAVAKKRCDEQKQKLVSAKRLISLYVVKLSLLTNDDVERNVEKVISNLIKEGDHISTFTLVGSIIIAFSYI